MEVECLRTNPAVDLISELPVDLSWFLVAVVLLVQQQGSDVTTLSQVMDKMNEMATRRNEIYPADRLKYRERVLAQSSLPDRFFNLSACRHYFNRLTECMILEPSPAHGPQALQIATKILEFSPLAIYEPGSLVIVSIGAGKGLEEILYGLKRGNCPVVKLFLKDDEKS